MHIIKLCCCQQLQIDWQNIILCDLDRNIIKLPALGKIFLWSTNDLESIETNILYQIRVYGRVLDLVIPLEIKDDVHIIDFIKPSIILQLERNTIFIVNQKCIKKAIYIHKIRFITSIHMYKYILIWGDSILQI